MRSGTGRDTLQQLQLIDIYRDLSDYFRDELDYVVRYVRQHPKSTTAVAFILGMITGGALKSTYTWLIIFSIIGGAPGAISFASLIGLHPAIGAAVAVIVNFSIGASVINVLYYVQETPAIAGIVARVRGLFTSIIDPFCRFAGRRGVFTSLVLFTFAIGLPTVLIADLIGTSPKQAKNAILTGFTLAGVFWTLAYLGLLQLIPDPTRISAIILFVVLMGVFYPNIKERIRGVYA